MCSADSCASTDRSNRASRDEIAWAPRVPKNAIRRLYLSDAQGLLDEELVEKVGIALYLRCEAILEVAEAKQGRVKCRRCYRRGQETLIERQHAKGQSREQAIVCPVCGWQVTWDEFCKSFRRKQLNAGGATSAFAGYVHRYRTARTARDKMLAIDRLIHEFHYSYRANPDLPTRPVGVNLIQGRLRDVIVFLNELGFGAASTEGLEEGRQRWNQTLETYRRDCIGGALMPKRRGGPSAG